LKALWAAHRWPRAKPSNSAIKKINLHVRGKEFEPKAHVPVPGALDLCFIATVPLDEVITKLNTAHWSIVEGPIMRTGAT